MDRWVTRVALVTGASSGIGAAICRTLVKHGMRVVGCARNVDRIKVISEELKNQPGSLLPIKCDLTKEDEIMSMFAKIKTEMKGVDVCINNAGMSCNESLLEGSVQSWHNMLDVNVVALCLCTKESVKSMRERGVNDGQVIHISSTSGHRVAVGSGAGIRFYAATKHAVQALTEGMRQELQEINSKIRIASISPGLVETEFMYRMFSDQQKAKNFYSSLQCLQAEDIAESVIHILSAPPHVQIHDIVIRPTEQKL